MTSTSVASKSVTEEQSAVMVRQLARVSFSSIAYGRQIFPEEDFEWKDVYGQKMQAFAKEGLSELARKFLAWLEFGVFDALEQGHLESCVMMVTADPAGQVVLEAWELRIQWKTDDDGNVFPEMATIGPTAGTAQPLQAPNFDRAYVTKQTRHTMRQLQMMLSCLMPLPESYWVGMRVVYREDTPEDYEPHGFRPMQAGQGLRFETEPVQLSVAPAIHTDYHAMGLTLTTVDTDSFEGSSQNPGIVRSSTDGSWHCDLSRPLETTEGAGHTWRPVQMESQTDMLTDVDDPTGTVSGTSRGSASTSTHEGKQQRKGPADNPSSSVQAHTRLSSSSTSTSKDQLLPDMDRVSISTQQQPKHKRCRESQSKEMIDGAHAKHLQQKPSAQSERKKRLLR